MDKARRFGLSLFMVCAVFNHLIAWDCYAQAARGIDEPAQNCLSLGADMISYQIACHNGDKDYISYSQAVRDKIRKRLVDSYRHYFKEGNVNLFFVIKSDGRLLDLIIDNRRSTDDKKLVDIAVSSLKEASPFSPFPKKLAASQLPFSITISFKEK